MATIAQGLGVKEFPFIITDGRGNMVYRENSKGYWSKWSYDHHGHNIFYENSNRFWCKSVFNSDGKEVYHETSTNWWCKTEYNSLGNITYYENSDGNINNHAMQKERNKKPGVEIKIIIT